jgi:hypothetical protein
MRIEVQRWLNLVIDCEEYLNVSALVARLTGRYRPRHAACWMAGNHGRGSGHCSAA